MPIRAFTFLERNPPNNKREVHLSTTTSVTKHTSQGHIYGCSDVKNIFGRVVDKKCGNRISHVQNPIGTNLRIFDGNNNKIYDSSPRK